MSGERKIENLFTSAETETATHIDLDRVRKTINGIDQVLERGESTERRLGEAPVWDDREEPLSPEEDAIAHYYGIDLETLELTEARGGLKIFTAPGRAGVSLRRVVMASYGSRETRQRYGVGLRRDYLVVESPPEAIDRLIADHEIKQPAA